VGRDSSVGIATCYGLDGPGIESRWWRDFPQPSSPALGPTQPPIPGSFPGVKRPGRGVDHPPHLTPRLKEEYSYTSTPPLGFRDLFWGELYLYLYHYHSFLTPALNRVSRKLHGPGASSLPGIEPRFVTIPSALSQKPLILGIISTITGGGGGGGGGGDGGSSSRIAYRIHYVQPISDPPPPKQNFGKFVWNCVALRPVTLLGLSEQRLALIHKRQQQNESS
jgi:hypothetical protein